MALVRFLRGADAAYSYNLAQQTTAHENAIYFAQDKGYLYVNGVRYGGDDAIKVKDVTVNGSVLTVTYTDNTTKQINVLDLIPEASDVAAGLMSAGDKEFVDELSSNWKAGMSFLSADQAATIQTVANGNYENKIETVSGSILSMNGKDITATVSLTYEDNTIKLLGKDSIVLGEVDATPFIKDGMISSAELVTDPEGQEPGKYLVLTWNTDAGESAPTYVPLTELVDVYTAGNAIEITSANEIKVVVADSTESETNYLVNEGGLKVSEMGAGVTKLSQDIQVVGGPLADDLAGIFENGVIPAGTSVETILMKMICKEIFPTASTSQGSISASMSLTTLALDPTDSTVEVGTIVTTNALTANNSTYTTTSAKISGLSNGYALTENGEKQTGDMEFGVEGVTEATNNHKITLAYSGFTETAPNAVEAATTVTMPAQSLIVREGECKVTATAGGSKFTATSPAVSQEYYNISNVNTRQKETKTIATKSLSSTASKSTNDKVTGVYKYFAGYYDFASNQTVEDVFTSAIVRGLNTHTGNITKDGTTTLVDSTSVTSNGKSIVVAVPSKYKLATFQNDLGGSEIANFSKIGTVAVANPTNANFTTDYTVYVWPVAGGATITYKNVTITKA